MKKYILGFIIFVSALVPFSSFASNFPPSEVWDGVHSTSFNTFGCSFGSLTVCSTSINGFSGHVSSVSVWLAGTPGQIYRFGICSSNTPSSTNILNGCRHGEQGISDIFYATTTLTGSITRVDFDTNFNFATSSYYAFGGAGESYSEGGSGPTITAGLTSQNVNYAVVFNSGPPTIEFTDLFSTSTPFADFVNWQFTVHPNGYDGIVSSTQLWVQYTQTPGTLSGDIYDTSGIISSSFFTDGDFLFQKSSLLYPLPSNVTSTHWYARGYYYINNSLVATTSIVNFLVNAPVDYNATSGIGVIAGPTFPFTQNPLASTSPSSSQPWYYGLIGGRTIDVVKDGQIVTSSLGFISCEDSWTIKSALCGMAYIILDPSWTGTPDFVKTASQKLNQMFPFSVVTGVAMQIDNQTQNYDYSNSDLLLDMSSTSPAFSAEDKIMLLSSSSLTALIGQSKKDELFQVEEYLVWFFVLLVTLFEVRKLHFF